MNLKKIYEYISIIRGKYSSSYPTFLKCIQYKLPRHKLAIPINKSLLSDAHLVEAFTKTKITNIFEIGANFAQDSAFLAHKLNIPHNQIYVFEAHPDICVEIKKFYPKMNIIEKAVFDTETTLKFNAIDIYKDNNSGISSLLDRENTAKNMKKIEVQTIRMDNFMSQHKIQTIDFLKIDTEGCTWEVLKSFGDKLSQIKSIQLEAETYPYWDNQKLFQDIKRFLELNNFYMVNYSESAARQCDSLWINKKYIVEMQK